MSSQDVLKKFAARTKKPLSWWKKELKKRETKDLYLDAKECLKYGIIDHIGVPRRKNKSKVVVFKGKKGTFD